jgi:hypothetical protein
METPARTAVEAALSAALYGQDTTALDTAASRLAADPPVWPAVGAELLRRGAELIRTAWERGWQPADVVRLVRRELEPVHVRLVTDLIAGETRRYGRTLDARWTAQLRELGAETPAWAPADDTAFVTTVGAREAVDRFTLATELLVVLRLLLRLPTIEAVGPVPGGGSRQTPPAAVAEPKQFSRIRALLAKAEATGFPDEAEALTAKAQELMARHRVDLDAGPVASEAAPAACRIGVDAPYDEAKAILLDAVAEANRCRAVWHGELGFSTVVGFPADLEAVELLYASLLVQGTAAMTRAEAGQRAGGRKRTKTFRQAFLLSYASRLGTRLTASAASASPASLLPVLATRDVAVAAHTSRMFPATSTSRVRGAYDEAGHAAGVAAAGDASLGVRRGVTG